MVGFYSGYYIGGFRVNQMDREVLEASKVGHCVYLIERFQRAFESADALVAISEGTNLLQYLAMTETNDRHGDAGVVSRQSTFVTASVDVGEPIQACVWRLIRA